jgi:hypothetical protein
MKFGSVVEPTPELNRDDVRLLARVLVNGTSLDDANDADSAGRPPHGPYERTGAAEPSGGGRQTTTVP